MATARPLRTTLPQTPRTQGERIRYARISANLTQQQLADAVSKITNGDISKATVSKWEGDATSNPTNANMLAIQAVTGFSMSWLVTGRGEMRVSTAPHVGIQEKALERALRAVFGESAGSKAHAVATLYDLIIDAPGVSDAVLQRTAAAITER
jgi:transcriptional regulator with XRE-family HTH domain